MKVPFKVGVDPTFRFDHTSEANESTQFYPVPSDRYFRECKPASFDLIFLDGLHTYDQTLRDFLNSMQYSHANTIWLLDDTIPNDVFSALPDQQECYRLRDKIIGGCDRSWMGDVYKVVFFIDRALPFFDFRTFDGHGQTVVWRRDRPRAGEACSVSVEKIGNMTYDAMVANLDLMKIDNDERIYCTVAEALAQPKS